MRTFLRFLMVFLVVGAAAALASGLLGVEFGRDNFWDHHGVFFLIFLATFPRLTLLFGNVAFGGVFWWLAWLFAPRLLVAVLATTAYWVQNPLLVVIAWVIALGGESSEKTIVIRQTGFGGGGRRVKHVKSRVES